MSGYAPTTDEVRAVWSVWSGYGGLTNRTDDVDLYGDREAEFDHWLNQVKADAWDLGHEACQRDWDFAYDLITPDSEREPWTNPYREEI